MRSRRIRGRPGRSQEHTALIIINPQCDFCSATGAMAQRFGFVMKEVFSDPAFERLPSSTTEREAS